MIEESTTSIKSIVFLMRLFLIDSREGRASVNETYKVFQSSGLDHVVNNHAR